MSYIMRNISFFFSLFLSCGIFVSKESINWQKTVSSSVSNFKDDDEAVEEYLFSSKEVTLQIAFCRTSGCDFLLDFICCPISFFFGVQLETLNAAVEVSDTLEYKSEVEFLKKYEAF